MSDYVENKVIDILRRLPSEGACFDYKQYPYYKNEDHKFVKDVDAIRYDQIRDYIPRNISYEETTEYIKAALKYYQEAHAKK